jgi:hypothetical protein
LIGKEIGMTFGERYLSKSAFSDTSEEHEMKEVDIGIKIDDLWREILGRNRGRKERERTWGRQQRAPMWVIEWGTDWLCQEGDAR